MGGFDYYSPQAIKVATESIRVESKKWHDMSDRMQAISNQANDLDLMVTAFLVADPTGPVTAHDLHHAYNQMFKMLTGLLKGAVTEFDQFGGALTKMANWYEDSDERSVVLMSNFGLSEPPTKE